MVPANVQGPAMSRRSWGKNRKLPSGRWQASYVGPDGVRQTAPNTFETKDDSVAWLVSERRLIDREDWTPPANRLQRESVRDSRTLRAYAAEWLDAKSTLKPRTRNHYESLLRLHILPTLGEVELVELTTVSIRTWHARLGSRTPTFNAHAYGLLHAVLATATEDGLIPINPARVKGAMTTKRAHTITVITQTELASLAADMPERLAMSVLLAGWCGLRWGETSELRRKDISADRSTLHVRRGVTYRSGTFTVSTPKTAAGKRDVAVPPHVSSMLAAHLADHVGSSKESLLFPSTAGGHMGDYEYRKVFKKAAAGIGREDLRVHDLRHVGAVLAAQAGGTTIELMHRLGHTTPAMALKYQHVAAGRDREIADRLSKMIN